MWLAGEGLCDLAVAIWARLVKRAGRLGVVGEIVEWIW